MPSGYPETSMDRLRAALRGSPEDDFAYGEGIPEDATWRNLLPMAEFGLGMAPVSGEAMAARDAWDASGRAGAALTEGSLGDAASEYLNMGTGLLGAIPGAGIVARGTKRGAAWMDRNLPEGFNRLLDSVYPQGYVPNDTAAAFPAWHGSPHDFDEFKLDKIGTGEGAQVYGHGLYFAENPATAAHYRDALSTGQRGVDPPWFNSIGGQLQHVGPDDAHDIAEGGLPAIQKRIAAIDETLSHEAQNRSFFGDAQTDEMKAYYQRERDELEQFAKTGDFSVRQGRLYKAEIDTEPEDLLDWDKPLSEQSEKIRTAVKSLFTKENGLGHVQDIDHLPGENILQLLRMGKAGPDRAASVLREAGIPGVRYLDQGSRAFKLDIPDSVPSAERGALEWAFGNDQNTDRAKAKLRAASDEDPAAKRAIALLEDGTVTATQGGTRNFVIFDDKLVKMLGKE
jgi:hypothetical protein